MKVAIACLLCIGFVSGFSFLRQASELTASKGQDGAIQLDWHDSIGLICDDGSEAENIAKVFCGGSAVKVTSPGYDVSPEFSLSGMKCSGNEKSLAECTFDETGLAGYHKCTTFVGANCEAPGKREGSFFIRGVL